MSNNEEVTEKAKPKASSQAAPQPRKSVSKAEREARTRQIVVIATIVVAVAVVLLIAFALINELLILPNAVVLRVGEDTISAADYKDHIHFDYMIETGGYPLDTLEQFFGVDPTLYEPETFSERVLISMAEDIIVRQKAAEFGIVISDEELQERVELDFGYDAGEPEPTSTPQPTATTGPTPRPSATPTFVFTLTPTLTPTPLAATNTPTPEPSPTSDEVLPTFTPEPSPTPVDQAGFDSLLEERVTAIASLTGLSEDRVRELWYEQTRDVMLRNRLLDKVLNDLEVPSIRPAHILVASEQEAVILAARIAAGEDFALLAAENSLDTSNAFQGGDLGWQDTRGVFVTPFDDVAWELEAGEVSQPVQTQFGWHIIKMLERKVIPASEATNFSLINQAFVGQIDAWREELVPELGDAWRNYVPDSLP